MQRKTKETLPQLQAALAYSEQEISRIQDCYYENRFGWTPSQFKKIASSAMKEREKILQKIDKLCRQSEAERQRYRRG